MDPVTTAEVDTDGRTGGGAAWDPTTGLLYGLKLLRLGIQFAALQFAAVSYDVAYTQAVHGGGGGPPPPLTNALLLFMCLDATGQLLVALLLLGFRFVYGEGGGGTLAVDDALVRAALTDYFVSSVVIGVVGISIAALLQTKKYFDFSHNGLRVMQAYRDAMFGVCAVSAIVPYGTMF